jgi:hypothetical protein
MTRDGAASSSTIEFNTATSRHLARFIGKMRPMPVDIGAHAQDVELARFNDLASENFKFMNYARSSLVGGEAVLKILLQPKICKPIISIGKHVFYQASVSMAHLLILTNKELIIIQDDARSGETRGVRYGGKWQYISLHHINTVSLSDRADGVLSLVLTLAPGKRQVEILFAASKRWEVVEF